MHQCNCSYEYYYNNTVTLLKQLVFLLSLWIWLELSQLVYERGILHVRTALRLQGLLLWQSQPPLGELILQHTCKKCRNVTLNFSGALISLTHRHGSSM